MYKKWNDMHMSKVLLYTGHLCIDGSLIACLASQVKETVMAYLVPLVTLSTLCKFSDPEVKAETRPGKEGNIFGFLFYSHDI